MNSGSASRTTANGIQTLRTVLEFGSRLAMLLISQSASSACLIPDSVQVMRELP